MWNAADPWSFHHDTQERWAEADAQTVTAKIHHGLVTPPGTWPSEYSSRQGLPDTSQLYCQTRTLRLGRTYHLPKIFMVVSGSEGLQFGLMDLGEKTTMKKSEKTLRDTSDWESQKENTEIKGQRDLTWRYNGWKLPNLRKEMDIKILAQCIPTRINAKRPTLRYIITQLSKFKNR